MGTRPCPGSWGCWEPWQLWLLGMPLVGLLASLQLQTLSWSSATWGTLPHGRNPRHWSYREAREMHVGNSQQSKLMIRFPPLSFREGKRETSFPPKKSPKELCKMEGSPPQMDIGPTENPEY